MENVLDLKMPGVQEMGKEELIEVDGGNPFAYVGGILLAALTYDLITEGSAACAEAFVNGWNSVE